MRERWLLILFAVSLACGIRPSDTAAEALTAATLADLRRGGYVILMSHGRTNRDSAFPFEMYPMDLANCAAQFALTDLSRDKARAVGAAFRANRIPVGKVLASGYCRTMETARLAFGRAEPSEILLHPDFRPVAGTVPPYSQRMAELKTMIATPPEAGTNTVLVTHIQVIKDMTGVTVDVNDTVIVKPDGRGGAAVVARVHWDEWPARRAAPAFRAPKVARSGGDACPPAPFDASYCPLPLTLAAAPYRSARADRP